VPAASTLAGHVLRTGRPERRQHLDEPAGLSTVLAGEVDVGPVLAVPLVGSRGVHGVLCAARLRGRPAFTAADLDMAASFANHAALAIELAEARSQQQRAAMLEERERIAADLHDHVIQRLFGAGLSLQTIAAGAGEGPMATRLLTTIQDLDDTIRQIRTTIFQLHQDPRTAEPGVRERLLGVVSEVSPALGFEPGVRFSGLLEDTLPGRLVEDLLAVLREALTNVARHAGARTADVDITAARGRLVLAVSDDGRGMGSTTRASGLANMRRRAEAHGGGFDVAAARPAGTRLTWWVPTGSAAPGGRPARRG
jgi:signal transduction histidine kinase